MNESELIARAQAGDLDAFGELVEACQERAIRAAFAFVGNYEDARDLAQEAFVKAYENLKNFRGGSRFYTWLYRILMNTAKDFLKKKRPVSVGEAEEVLLNTPSPMKDSGAQLLNRETGAEIRKALEKLPFQQKSAFLLRYFEGLSLEETADSMGISLGAVKATLWQACDKMKKMLRVSLELGEGAR